MSVLPAWAFTGLLVIWALTSVTGVEIDGKLEKLETESSEAIVKLVTLETETSEAIDSLLIESTDGGVSLCPPNTKCLLLNLVLGPKTSLVSLVPLVPVVKGQPVGTSITVVPVIKGKPTEPPVPRVPVIKGTPVKPVVPLVPVVKGKPVTNTSPVTRKPFHQGSNHRRTKPKVITLCCFDMQTYYDYLGRPCNPSYFPVVTSKPARPPTGTVLHYPSGIYPSSRYPGAKPSGSYPSNRYPGTVTSYPSNKYPGTQPADSYPSVSYPSNRYPGTAPSYPSNSYPGTQHAASYPSNKPPGAYPPGNPVATRPLWQATPRPVRPPYGGVAGSPWAPLGPSTPTVVKVDGKLGLSSDAEGSETGDSQVGGKVDGKLGEFQ